MKTANETIAEILVDKYYYLFEIIPLIYSAEINIIEEINGIGSYHSGTQSPKIPPCINCIERALSAVAETGRNENKNIKKKAIA